MHPMLREFEGAFMKRDIPYFRPGDTVRVSVRIVEGDKERLQDYQGVVIARRGSGTRESFIVRRVSFGVGMERVFPLHSPRLDSITVVRRARVRRAKLYYLRNLRGKKARLTERRVSEQKLASEAEAMHGTINRMIDEREQSDNQLQEEAKAAAEAQAAAEAPAAEEASEAQPEEAPAEEKAEE